MRPGSPAWWLGKVRQTKRHLLAKVWLTAPQLALFDRMHVADRRHGLDVVAALRAGGEADPEVLIAGLLHDAGKGNTGLVPRVVASLGQAGMRPLVRVARRLPPMAVALDRLDAHAQSSALLALEAGCTERTAELIRWQDDPRDLDAGERLRLADEAS